ncbi:MAG: Protein GrpE [Candidatus Pacebacteria bacterium GW2011_GWA1_46_10]|nr:MAG: Protein GrpE [Candidatus Pacebacteria bacterium GW2011_GWA1_46_10]HCR81755.1 nucleotide exchange factor GrpE [Candidatus Paceibacterota bacterium]
MSKKSPKTTLSIESLQQQIAELEQKFTQTQEKEKRALADYQNLVRRNQEERLKLIQMANLDLMLALLQPLGHLERAVEQTKDKGVAMVLEQFKRTLNSFGLEEIEVQDQPFDVETMEAAPGSQGKIVKQVIHKGYRLNGRVIQHAKVILG